MGLHSNDRGVKRELIRRHSNACYRAAWVPTAYRDLSFEHETTVTIRDANVMLMGACNFERVRSLDEFVEYVSHECMKMLHSARCVVLCVDEPESVPVRKLATQNKRDASRKKLQLAIQDDQYTLDDLLEVHSCGELVQNRKTRYRFMDELFRCVFAVVEANLAMIDDEEEQDGDQLLLERAVFIIDGVDIRGANRPSEDKRMPTIIGTDQVMVEQLLSRRSEPIGEADVKTVDVDNHFRDHAHEWPVSVIVHDTVDTDVIPAMLLSTSSRSQTPRRAQTTDASTNSEPRSFIMFRERGNFAIGELERMEGDRKRKHDVMQTQTDKKRAGVLLMDFQILHHALLRYMLGDQWMKHDRRVWHKCIRLMVSAWIMSGCDYCDHLAHGDLLMQSARVIAKRSFHEIPDDFAFENWNVLLRRILVVSGEYDKRITLNKRDKLVGVSDEQIENVPWLVGYWETLR